MHRITISIAVAFICLAVLSSGFQFIAPHWQHQQNSAHEPSYVVFVDVPQQLQRARTPALHLHHDSAQYEVEGRRIFLKQICAAITGAVILPQLGYAEEEDEATPTATIEFDKVDTIIKEEGELDAEVIKEEEDEIQSLKDEEQLLEEIEKEITIEENDSATPEEIEEEATKVSEGEAALIKEEEKLLSEAEDIITKIEAIESEVRSLDDTENSAKEQSNESSNNKESEAFVDKLKERVEQKEDLIERLKRASERDIDPKTGKFKSMSQQEYKERAKSTDADVGSFLKDTITNEQEWKRDEEAFEGFLEREFGPALKELKKDLGPLVGEAKKNLAPIVDSIENEIKTEVAPAMEKEMQILGEKAKAVADSEAEVLKEKAGELMGKLRSMF